MPDPIPKEAREGVERVWLAILRERHPGWVWRIVRDEDGDPVLDVGPPDEGEDASETDSR